MRLLLLVASVLLTALLPTAQAWAAEAICACYYGDNDACEYFYDEDGVSFPTSRNECNLFCLEEDRHPDTTDIDWAQDSDSEAGIDVGADCNEAEEQAADAAAVAAAVAAEAPSSSGTSIRPLLTPQLEIPIPDLSFADAVADSNVVTSNFIGQYVSGVYKFLIGFALTIAIVMMMIGGLQYVIGASSGDIGKAKDRIKNAITGFVLLLFVYVILFTVNPELTVFKSLTLTMIPPGPEENEDDFITGASVAVNFETPVGTNISGAGKTKVPSELTTDIDAAATTLSSQGYGMSISSSFRSVEKQVELIYKNCQNLPGSDSCNHKPGRPGTCILRGMDPASCPHTTGRALDIWGTKSEAQCISQDNCLNDLNACRANPCQGALIAAMKAEGFCNLESEPWHFEQPAMSSTCN